MYIVVILLGTSVGASTSAEAFLNTTTLKIVALGLIAFMFGTAAGVLFGKLLCFLTKGKINPLIGSAGVSAVPMAARVSQKVGAAVSYTHLDVYKRQAVRTATLLHRTDWMRRMMPGFITRRRQTLLRL